MSDKKANTNTSLNKSSVYFGLNSKKKKSKRLFLKLFVAYLAVYTGISLGYAAFGPRNHEHREFHLGQYTSSILMQPAMELLADGKISYWYDWEVIETTEINKSIPAAKIYSQPGTYRDYNKDLTIKNMFADLGKVQESAIIKPKNYTGKWSLIFCTEDESLCKKSNIVVTGKAKILVDGNTLIWALDQENNLIPLDVVSYTSRDVHKEYPLL